MQRARGPRRNASGSPELQGARGREREAAAGETQATKLQSWSERGESLGFPAFGRRNQATKERQEARTQRKGTTFGSAKNGAPAEESERQETRRARAGPRGMRGPSVAMLLRDDDLRLDRHRADARRGRVGVARRKPRGADELRREAPSYKGTDGAYAGPEWLWHGERSSFILGERDRRDLASGRYEIWPGRLGRAGSESRT
jgi:hypothetical protein